MCGAKNISIYMESCQDTFPANTTLLIPEGTESFAFYGDMKTYNDLTIISKAKTTIINGVTIINAKENALVLDSENVELKRVSIQTPKWGLVLNNETSNITFKETNTIDSTGNNAILARNVKVYKEGYTAVSVKGNVYYCGTLEDSNNLLETCDKHSIDIGIYNQLKTDSLTWVLESELPNGATVVDEKWTYDLITNITSDKPEVEGYELYDTTSEWSEYGAWSSWSTTTQTASDSRKIESRKTYKYYYFICTNCGAHMHVSDQCFTWAGGCGRTGTLYYEEAWIPVSHSSVTWQNPYGTGKYFADINGYGRMFRPTDLSSRTEYRYADRELIYTYYLTKTDEMESETAITASETITNIQKWVKYIVE